ncbi:MAG: hypothetical protein P4L76_03510 [Beijerinckiaceae bacterium]|nr:hypothetical protein [Beijerinckiaceae bacterium]
MKVHYITCAKSSSVDSKTNQLSLFHVLDEIGAAAFPLHLHSVCVAALFEREAEDAVTQSYALVVKLDGGLLASFTMTIDFSGARRNRSVNTVQGLTIPAAGAVTIAMVQKGKVLAEWRALALLTGAAGSPSQAEAPPAPASEPAASVKTAAMLN